MKIASDIKHMQIPLSTNFLGGMAILGIVALVASCKIPIERLFAPNFLFTYNVEVCADKPEKTETAVYNFLIIDQITGLPVSGAEVITRFSHENGEIAEILGVMRCTRPSIAHYTVTEISGADGRVTVTSRPFLMDNNMDVFNTVTDILKDGYALKQRSFFLQYDAEKTRNMTVPLLPKDAL